MYYLTVVMSLDTQKSKRIDRPEAYQAREKSQANKDLLYQHNHPPWIYAKIIDISHLTYMNHTIHINAKS